MNLVLEEIQRMLAIEPTLTQGEIAERLGVSQPMVNRWLNGGQPSAETMVAVLTRLNWDLSRARPDYDPMKDALVEAERVKTIVLPVAGKAAKGRAPMFTGDGKPASAPQAVRVHAAPSDPLTEEVNNANDLWRTIVEIRARMEETRRLALSPEGEAPRAALILTATGEIILDPSAPLDTNRRAITSAAGLIQLFELSKPKLWGATKGPLIIARQDRLEADGSERIHVLREPKDSRPRNGSISLIEHPERERKLYLRRLVDLPGVDGKMLAEGTSPGHESFVFVVGMAPVVAVQLAVIP